MIIPSRRHCAPVQFLALALCSLLLCPVSPSPAQDCNNNGIPDFCDLACGPPAVSCPPGCGASLDCNANGIPDDCDVNPLDPDGNGQVSPDCGGNGVPDECDPDCNANGIPDDCDVNPLDPDGNGQVSLDCNANGTPDECELIGNDCNANGTPDECELVGNDCNANGILDDCEVFPFTQRAKLTAADAAADDRFGISVSISGDTAVIGANKDDDAANNSGSAYIFVFAGGVWTQQDKLTAADGAASDFFGTSVSISGDTAVIGANKDDDAGFNSGSTYVFVRSGGVWTQQAKLTAADGAFGDEFGFSVSISGETAVIGSPLDDDAGGSSGSAYVFVRSGGVWTQQAKLTAADGAFLDVFGFSVSISGETTVIGARRDDDAGSSSGSAYVFVRSGGVWTQQAKLTAADGAANDLFGESVSISGDTAIIGALRDDGAGSDSGSAYVFFRTGGIWTQQAKLTAADGAANDLFGESVSISGDTAVIGAVGDDDAGDSSGSAYVFFRSGGVWTQQAKLTAADAAAGDNFGNSVSISGDTPVIGSTHDDDAGSSSGSAYVFTPSSDCNANGIPDECEVPPIGVGPDCNSNDIPDECEAGLALDIPGFVGVLIGTNLDPVDVCQADVNGDTIADGLDIQPFVDRLLGP